MSGHWADRHQHDGVRYSREDKPVADGGTGGSSHSPASRVSTGSTVNTLASRLAAFIGPAILGYVGVDTVPEGEWHKPAVIALILLTVLVINLNMLLIHLGQRRALR